MGHIKLAKSGGQFDILGAQNIASVKQNDQDDKVIDVNYISGEKIGITLAASQAANNEDVFEVVKALDLMDGTSGPAPLVKLSQFVDEIN